MKHAKIVFAISLALLAGLPLIAQSTSASPTTPAPTASPVEVGTPNAQAIGVETAQQKLKEVSIDKFEQAGSWYAAMSPDEGFITARLFNGSPAGKANEPIPDERLINIDNKVADTQVLGVRVEYIHRGFTSFVVRAKKPIPVEGISKTLSVWVVGRNYDNELKVIVSDFYGREFELPMGTLNFQGWKKLSVAVPPQSFDGHSGIVQRDSHSVNHTGLKVVGFRVDCDPLQAYGTYYIYFDDIRAVTDLFAEDNRDTDDMVDNW